MVNLAQTNGHARARGHSARHVRPYGQAPIDDLVPAGIFRVPGLRARGLIVMVVGMCSVEGLTSLIPSEGGVDQPLGRNELWLWLRRRLAAPQGGVGC